MSTREQDDVQLAFTVATVWREQRVSCPHPDILRAWLADALPQGAMEFVTFHLRESCCPYCGAVVEEQQALAADAATPKLIDLRDKLLRSTVTALRAAKK